jgi:hypothetical protein
MVRPLSLIFQLRNSVGVLGGLWLATGLLALTGCGGSGHPPTVAVSGTVTFQGEPLTNGTVRFVPVDPQTGRPAEGIIGPDGKFTLSTFSPGDGVLAGDYGISITSYKSGEEKLAKDKDLGLNISDKSAIPEKYNNVKTSGLNETINSGEPKKDLLLELAE